MSRKNLETIVQIFILLAIALLFIFLIFTKKISFYVHPRFYFGIILSAIVLIIFAVSLLNSINKARHNVNLKHYIIFLIPAIAFVLYPVAGTNNTSITFANTSMNNYSVQGNEGGETINKSDMNQNDSQQNVPDQISTDQTLTDQTSTDQTDSQYEQTQINEQSEPTDASLKYDKYVDEDGTYEINDDIFASWYDDVYDNLDDFIGKRYTYLAQVFFMDDFADNQFLAGRYFMVCCAADLAGYGIICESDKVSELSEQQWIMVTGTVDKMEHGGYEIPKLTDVVIAEGSAPEVEYIYYNNY